MPRGNPRPLAQRFWEKVDRTGGPENCWTWIGGVDNEGYGTIGLSPSTKIGRAHRVS